MAGGRILLRVTSAQPGEAAPTAKRVAVQAAVLRATEELLREGASYADLNVERIANAAGISRTAFYFYFADKRELLMRLTEDVNELLFAEADIWFSGHGDPDDEMRAALANIGALYDVHGVLLRAIVEVSAYDEEVASFWRALIGRFIDATRRRIDAERTAGRAASGDPHAIAFALCWMTERTFYQHLVQDGLIDRDALIDALTGVWLRTVYA